MTQGHTSTARRPGDSKDGLRRVAVVIVTFQARHFFERCIESLVSERCELKVIVVDNASTDGTPDLIAARFPEVQLIRRDVNLGFGGGNNIGIDMALAWDADHIFLFNQDAFVIGDAIDHMADHLERHPEVGVCSPLHCSPDDRHIDPKTLRYYLLPYAAEFLSDALLGDRKASYRIRGINAAAWYIRASVLREHGGFDPLFFMYAEDDDLLDRWQQGQVRFELLTGAGIVHLRQSAQGPSGRAAAHRRRVERARSRLLLQMKRAASEDRPTWRAALRVGFVDALSSFIAERSLKDLAAALQATAGVLGEQGRIRSHARLCRGRGPHFLNLPTS